MKQKLLKGIVILFVGGFTNLLATLTLHKQDVTNTTVVVELNPYDVGLGDQLMFVRYARDLKRAGAQVIVKTIERLQPLFRLCDYIDEVVTQLPTYYDYLIKCDITSLLNMQSNELTTIPYLKADPVLVKSWQKKIPLESYNVGIFWKHTKHVQLFRDKYIPGPKAIPLSELATLTQTPKVNFYSLEVIYWPDTIEDVESIGITVLSEELDTRNGAFMDTAAIMANMDLIITVDSAVAHLAGALGLPVWMLLSIESDVRWQQEKKKKWYPTMHIYRSSDLHSWIPLLETVQDDLLTASSTHTYEASKQRNQEDQNN